MHPLSGTPFALWMTASMMWLHALEQFYGRPEREPDVVPSGGAVVLHFDEGDLAGLARRLRCARGRRARSGMVGRETALPLEDVSAKHRT
jgi:hypothetical protein